MLINAHTAISTPKVLLVPYLPYHVAKYHTWMQDPTIQTLTASEPLTLEEEYAMQKSWRRDVDKLTFIIYEPTDIEKLELVGDAVEFGEDGMIGDVNLFITSEDVDEDNDSARLGERGIVIVGEVELMIAEKEMQGKGYGRAALMAFLMYVIKNETRIVEEFLRGDEAVMRDLPCGVRFEYFRVKIGRENVRSIRLFESVGFLKCGEEVNYFGEFELRCCGLRVEELMGEKGIVDFKEIALKEDRGDKVE